MREEKIHWFRLRTARFLAVSLLISAVFALFLSDGSQEVSGIDSGMDGPYITAEMIPAESYDLNIYCPNGSAPTIDGLVTAADGWVEAPRTVQESDEGTIHIRSKHDLENIYFLIETWDCTPPDEILLEDDGLYPDGILDGNDDGMYVGASGFPSGFRDSHGPSWSVDSVHHGGANGKGSTAYFRSEWWKPLNSGDSQDINVTSDEILGFAVGGSYETYEWPLGYNTYNSSTYGNLHVIFDDNPGNLSLISPINNTHITPGTRIDFAVSGRNQTARYSFDGTAFSDFIDPFVFNTADWEDGPYRIWLEIDFQGGRRFSRTYDFVIDGSGPEFDGIGSAVSHMNGMGAHIEWDPAVDLTPPVEYLVYLSTDRTRLFDTPPRDTVTVTEYDFRDLETGTLYHAGVRSRDGLGLTDKNTVAIEFTPEIVLLPHPDVDPSMIPPSSDGEDIYAFMGGTPVVDGAAVDLQDKWFETTETIFTSGNDRFAISAKHDMRELFILINSTIDNIDEFRLYINDGDDGLMGLYDGDLKIMKVGMYMNDLYSSDETDYIWYEDRELKGFYGAFGSSGNGSITEFRIALLDDTGEDLFITGNDRLDFAFEIESGDYVRTWPPGADVSGRSSSTWGSLYMIFDGLPTEVKLTSPEQGEIIPDEWDFEIDIRGEAKSIHFAMDDDIPIPYQGTIGYDSRNFNYLTHGFHNWTITCLHYHDDPVEFTFPFQVDAAVDPVANLDFEETDEPGIYRIFWDHVDDDSLPVRYRIFDLGNDQRIDEEDDFIETEENQVILDLRYLRINWETNIAVVSVDSLGNKDHRDLQMISIIRVDDGGSGGGGEPVDDNTPPSPFIEYPRISSPAHRTSYEDILVSSDEDTDWVEIYVMIDEEWVMLNGTVWDGVRRLWRVEIDLSEWENGSLDIRVVAGDGSGNVGETELRGIPVVEDDDEVSGESGGSDELIKDLFYIPIVILAVLFIMTILLIFFFAMIKRDYDLVQSGQEKVHKGIEELVHPAPNDPDEAIIPSDPETTKSDEE
ncbi:MAG: hypothetical protein ACMUIG_03240 [Thermoplasmatota archaeon]